MCAVTLIKSFHRRSRLAGWAALVTAMLPIVLAGCGGDDGDETAEGGDSTAIVAEAEQMLEAAKEPLTFKPPGEPIDASTLSGRTVAIVSTDQRVPILATTADHIAEAADVAGLQTTVFDAQSEVTRMQQGVEQGIRGADAIVLLGVPIDLVEEGLKEAKKAGMPVVTSVNNQPDPDAPGQGGGPFVSATSGIDYRKAGELVAAQAIADTNGDANLEIFTTEVTVAPTVVEGMSSVLDRCETCNVSENTTPVAEWATELTPKATSVVRGNPNLSYALPIFDAMMIFIAPGIEQAAGGDRVKVSSINGTPAALELIQSGDVAIADVGESFAWQGWHTIDQAMRAMLRVEPSDPVVPMRLLDDSTLEGVDVNDVDAPYGDDLGYREGFEELWGVG